MSFCAGGIIGGIGLGLHDVLDGVVGDAVALQILFDGHAAALRLASALFGEVVRKRLIINEPGFAEACHHLCDGVGCETALSQAILDFTLTAWTELEEADCHLFGTVISISGNELGDLSGIKRLTHEETFVGQGVETHPQGKFAVNDEVDPARVTGLGANRRNRAWLWIILRRCHRRRLWLPPWARRWCHAQWPAP